jgi:hypothetical protein
MIGADESLSHKKICMCGAAAFPEGPIKIRSTGSLKLLYASQRYNASVPLHQQVGRWRTGNRSAGSSGCYCTMPPFSGRHKTRLYLRADFRVKLDDVVPVSLYGDDKGATHLSDRSSSADEEI